MSIKDKDSNVFVSLGLVLVDIYAAIPPRNASSLWGRLLKVAIVLGLLFLFERFDQGLVGAGGDWRFGLLLALAVIKRY